MKKLLISCLLIFNFNLSFAQNEKYIELMEETITLMDTAETMNTLQQAASLFERIGNKMQTEWLPYYYSAYCYAQISHKEKEDKKKDLYVDKAEEFIGIADKINPENSEIYVMKGFILQARMNIDPMIRGFKYNSKCLKMFEKAMKLNPDNPRSYLWHGVNLYNTPSFFGGGKNKALPLLENAIEKYNSFTPLNSIYPNWGKKYAEEMIIKCK
ncbi:MAG: hypothetical protein KAT68_18820 [Bacteroidales bacterium]|nr:hypothetical protein [Bacteroidales bacterium]